MFLSYLTIDENVSYFICIHLTSFLHILYVKVRMQDKRTKYADYRAKEAR